MIPLNNAFKFSLNMYYYLLYDECEVHLYTSVFWSFYQFWGTTANSENDPLDGRVAMSLWYDINEQRLPA